MSDIRVSRWGTYLKRLTGHHGVEQGSTMIDDVMPVAPILSADDVVYAWQRGEVLCNRCQLAGAGGAGTYSTVYWSNPDPATVAHLRWMVVESTSVVIVCLSNPTQVPIPAPSANPGLVVDTRHLPPVVPAGALLNSWGGLGHAVIWQDTTLAVPWHTTNSRSYLARIPANATWEMPFDFVMGPASPVHLTFSPVTANVQVNVSLGWTERWDCEPGECR